MWCHLPMTRFNLRKDNQNFRNRHTPEFFSSHLNRDLTTLKSTSGNPLHNRYDMQIVCTPGILRITGFRHKAAAKPTSNGICAKQPNMYILFINGMIANLFPQQSDA